MLALPHKITSDSRKYIYMYIIVTACLSKGLAQKLVFFSLYFERFDTNYSSGRKTCKKCSLFAKPSHLTQVLSLSSPNRVDARQVGGPKFNIKIVRAPFSGFKLGGHLSYVTRLALDYSLQGVRVWPYPLVSFQ